MHVVIVGAGTVGIQVARELIQSRINVSVIESDPTVVHTVANQLDCLMIQGKGNSLEVLKQAGVEKADFFLALTGSDEVNMICCGLITSEYQKPVTMARVRNLDYANIRHGEVSFLGIDHVVNPDLEAAKSIIRSIEYGAVGDVLSFEQSGVQMRNLVIREDSSFKNRMLKNIRKELHPEFLVAVILRADNYLIPSGDSMLLVNDNLYLIGTKANLDDIFAYAGRRKQKLNKIAIVGGGKIASLVADSLIKQHVVLPNLFLKLFSNLLSKTRRDLSIVERDREKCETLAKRFPGAMIINADITDEDVFDEERLASSDAILSITDNQELNIVTSLYAKSRGVQKTIALVTTNNYLNIAAQLAIDVAVSVKNAMVNTILKQIRGDNVKSVHSISEGKMEVLELAVSAGSKMAGKRVKNIRFPKNALLLSITRGTEHIMPDGESLLSEGDNIILIARKESVPAIEDMFVGKP